MPRAAITVAEIFRRYGDTFRAQAGAALSTAQRRVMTAIGQCRTVALGGHVEQCDHCGHRRVWYNSCRNRHCPTCQSLARAAWLERRRADLLPTEYFHVVFTVPPAVAEVATQNKAVVYGLLFRAVADTLRTIAADPRHLGAEIGFFAVLHTWGQTLVHHPHLHCVIPGGGLASDGSGWAACRPRFFLPVRVLSRYFRHVLLHALQDAFESGQLRFAGRLQSLSDPRRFAEHLRPAREAEWVVYAKRPFAGPEQVLDYLGRYTHRIAIGNQRICSVDDGSVRFRYTDYRRAGASRQKTMTLTATEFIRRMLIVTLAATAATSRNPADDGRWTRLVSWTRRRLWIPRHRDPLTPLVALAAAGTAYTAAIGAIHLTPWTSPTPLNSGTYGQLMGGMTMLAALQGAAVAGVTWYAVARAARRRQSRTE